MKSLHILHMLQLLNCHVIYKITVTSSLKFGLEQNEFWCKIDPYPPVQL